MTRKYLTKQMKNLADQTTQVGLDWMQDAKCATEAIDPDTFFAENKDDAMEAIAMCGTCPVRFQCLTYALQTREDWGVWGGVTTRRRRNLLKNRGAHEANNTNHVDAVARVDELLAHAGDTRGSVAVRPALGEEHTRTEGTDRL